ncbi:MAG: hypothetical protein WCI62_01180 [Erysipelotrichaceae bacterium]
MKRSIWALVYAIMFTFYFPLIIVVRMISLQPPTINQDGFDYSMLYRLLVILGCNLVISIIGSICAWMGYRNSKYKLIIFTIILSSISVIIFMLVPVYQIVAIPLLGLGIMSLIDIKSINKMAKSANY